MVFTFFGVLHVSMIITRQVYEIFASGERLPSLKLHLGLS